MGRTFETLRGLDVARPPAADMGRRVPPHVVPPGPMPEPDFDFGDASVPFIEVGGPAGEAPGNLHIDSPPRVVSAPGPVKTESAPAPVRFVPRPAPLAALADGRRELGLSNQSQGVEAEQYRQIRDALRPALAQFSLRSVLLIPADDAIGSTATLNLALAFADDGESAVLVIDADQHRACVATALELALAPGWAELLVGLPLPQALQDAGMGRLHVIAAGNRLVEGTAVLHGERVREILEECKRRYQIVLVQGPGWSDAAELGTLARSCDAVCLVHSAATAPAAGDSAALRSLQRQGLRVLGSILTSN